MPWLFDKLKTAASSLPKPTLYFDGIGLGKATLRLSNLSLQNSLNNIKMFTSTLTDFVTTCGKPAFQLISFSLMAVRAAAQQEIAINTRNGNEKMVMVFEDTIEINSFVRSVVRSFNSNRNVGALAYPPQQTSLANSTFVGDFCQLLDEQGKLLSKQFIKLYCLDGVTTNRTACATSVITQKIGSALNQVCEDTRYKDKVDIYFGILFAIFTISAGVFLAIMICRLRNEERAQQDRIIPPAPIPTPEIKEEKSELEKPLQQLQDKLELFEICAEHRENKEEILNDLAKFKNYLKRFLEHNTCGISLDFLLNPVTLSSGITFNKSAIKGHLETKQTCPLSGKQLLENNTTVLSTNINLVENLKITLEILDDLLNTVKAKHSLRPVVALKADVKDTGTVSLRFDVDGESKSTVVAQPVNTPSGIVIHGQFGRSSSAATETKAEVTLHQRKKQGRRG